MYDWDKLFTELLKYSKELGWDESLYHLIAESYEHEKSEEDTKILCVLIVLHEAIKGEISLERLAQSCMLLSRMGKTND